VNLNGNRSAQRPALPLTDVDLAEIPPLPARSGRGRAIVLISAGIALAVLLSLVLLNIDRGEEGDRDRKTSSALDPTIAPPSPGIEQATDMQSIQGDPSVVETKRGWIQATENGRLSQEYRYARSEPGPGGRLRMTKPEVKIYMKDRRVLSLRGESADVHAPGKALESGTMTGEVLIRLYELDIERQLDDARDVPVLEVHTPEVTFDNFQGEIICPGDVDIQTRTAHVPAIGLRMQINDLEGRPGQLVINRLNGEVRLSEALQDRTAAADGAADAAPASAGAASQPQPMAAAADHRERPAQARGEGGAGAGANMSERAQQRQHDRARERRENRQPQPQPIAAQQGPYFYRLTLNQNVRIRQGDGSVGWTAFGEQLHIIFSLDSEDLSDSLSMHNEPAAVTYGPAEPMPIAMRLAMLTVASIQESSQAISTGASGLFKPSESDTIITCDGSLTMTPLVNAAEQPASPKDSRFELIGSPVRLHNNEDRSDITCATLQYASLSEVMTLIGSAQHRLIIDSPELHAECDDRFWMDHLNSIGEFEGGGWMLAGEPESDQRAATQPNLPLSVRGDVRIAWSEGVDLVFQPATTGKPSDVKPEETPPAATAHDSFGRLREAMFNGAVDVNSPDFTLTSERMTVGFPIETSAVEGGAPSMRPADRVASIEFIHAQENVKAGSLSDGGSIDCQDLRVNFANHLGKTVPLNMLAAGDVAAVDRDGQTVWSDELEVKFRPIAETQPDDVSAGHGPWQEPPPADAEKASRRRADVESLTAKGSVQIQMADGARVFADRLEADGEGNKIVLTGEDVMVVSDRNIIGKGRRLELTERGERVVWPGPGEFTYYTNPILAAVEPRRIARPVVDPAVNPRQMLALWNESMEYDGTANGGAGSLEIRGSVNAESTPSALELNKMMARELTLLFAKAETTVPVDPATMPASAPATQPAGGLFAMEQRGRQLKQLIARGEARLESRAWQNADHSDLPRVFHLAGDHVTYDDQTLEANVQGKGSLLVRDERPAPADPASTQPEAGARQANLPFGARGTTLFNWNDSLQMTRKERESSLYDIVMIGGIEVRHRALDNSLSTMTGDRLEATVDRTQGATQRDAGFDLGGSMDLKRIQAKGGVYVDSPTRDVDCDEFDYDYVTGVAQLNAREGRTVTIVTAGNPHPVQARSFLWNTIDDTVVVKGASGSSGR